MVSGKRTKKGGGTLHDSAGGENAAPKNLSKELRGNQFHHLVKNWRQHALLVGEQKSLPREKRLTCRTLRHDGEIKSTEGEILKKKVGSRKKRKEREVS